MKVLLINGSAKEKGCTFTALSEVARGLNESGVETEILSLGTKPVADCMGCGKCRETGSCVFGDIVNEIVEKAKTADKGQHIKNTHFYTPKIQFYVLSKTYIIITSGRLRYS